MFQYIKSMFQCIKNLERDPHEEVRNLTKVVVNCIEKNLMRTSSRNLSENT